MDNRKPKSTASLGNESEGIVPARRFEAQLKTLGSRIAKYRSERGISMERLAHESDISKGNLCDIERGRRDPRFSTLRSIASGLEISTSQLLVDL